MDEMCPKQEGDRKRPNVVKRAGYKNPPQKKQGKHNTQAMKRTFEYDPRKGKWIPAKAQEETRVGEQSPEIQPFQFLETLKNFWYGKTEKVVEAKEKNEKPEGTTSNKRKKKKPT